MNSFEEVFENVKNYCLENNKIPEIGVTTWINAMKPVGLNGSDAVFSVQTEFQKNIVFSNFESALSEAFLNVLGFKVNLVINVESEERSEVHVPTDDEIEEKEVKENERIIAET